jgi:hypothetical protein
VAGCALDFAGVLAVAACVLEIFAGAAACRAAVFVFGATGFLFTPADTFAVPITVSDAARIVQRSTVAR